MWNRFRRGAGASRGIRRGFTLIELLVVIAIIAILASILFPVFAQAREAARKTTCVSNQKQLGTSMMLYVQDYDEAFPPLWEDNNSTHVLWNQIIYTYVKNQGIFRCPTDGQRNSVTTWAGAGQVGYLAPFPTSYIVNFQMNGVGSAQVQQPSTTVFMCDGGVQTNGAAPFVTSASPKKLQSWILEDPTTDPTCSSCPALTSSTNADWAGPDPRHQNGTVVMFMDGHAKAMTPDKFYFGNSPWLDPRRGG